MKDVIISELLTLYCLHNQFKKSDILKQVGNCSSLPAFQHGGKKKWKTLYHNGVSFPPEYVPHNIPILYENKEIKLDPLTEEYITLYAKYLDTDYITHKTFNINFWKDFKKYAKPYGIESLEKLNLKPIKDYLQKIKEIKQNLSDEAKAKIKEEKIAEDEKYNTAQVDGKAQPVGNFRMEPPGIFMGRGDHPLLGSIKRRIYPEDVTLNLSSDAKTPETIPNHKWGKIKHDHDVEWIASWKDTITGKAKYVWLASHSDMKGKNDMAKFDLAKKLKRKIKDIRKANEENMQSSDISKKQIATAIYFIDKLALRVGNEKGEDACDTVGVTSLRCEHIKLLPDNKVKLDFLGKDSVRYVNTIVVNNIIYNNLTQFMSNKDKSDELFDKASSNDLNKYLQNFMKDLTAKVFRTYNATTLFEHELSKLSKKYPPPTDGKTDPTTIKLLLDGFNNANAKVALLCNHQRQVSAGFDDQVSKLKKQINEIKNKIKKIEENKKPGDSSSQKISKLRNKLKLLKTKKKLKLETKNVSLGTSKINYIDPRVTIKFIKRHNIPIEKIFTKTLINKFKWAIDEVELTTEKEDDETDNYIKEVIN